MHGATVAAMADLDDVRRIALSLPETAEKSSRDGRAHWQVKDKLFVWERPLRQSDLRAFGAAAPDGTILGARVPDEGAKLALVSAQPDIYFNTPHFNGYPAVLLRLALIPLASSRSWSSRRGSTGHPYGSPRPTSKAHLPHERAARAPRPIRACSRRPSATAPSRCASTAVRRGRCSAYMTCPTTSNPNARANQSCRKVAPLRHDNRVRCVKYMTMPVPSSTPRRRAQRRVQLLAGVELPDRDVSVAPAS